MMEELPHQHYLKVDLRGHCAFCLTRLGKTGQWQDGQGQSSDSLQGGLGQGSVLGGSSSFDHIWGYLLRKGGEVEALEAEGSLRGRWRYSFVGGDGRIATAPGGEEDGSCRVLEIPPMCGYCGDLIQELEGLHRELTRKVEGIHRIVLGSRRSWKGEELGKVLENSSLGLSLKESTLQFLDKLLESSRESLADRHHQESRGHRMDGEDDEHIKEEVESLVSSDVDEARMSGMESPEEEEDIPGPGESRRSKESLDQEDVSDDEANSQSAHSPPPSYSSNDKAFSRPNKRKRHCRTSSQRKCKRSPTLDETLELESEFEPGSGNIDIDTVKEEADAPPPLSNNEDDDNISHIEYDDQGQDNDPESDKSQSEEEEEKVVKVRRRVNRRKKSKRSSTSKTVKKLRPPTSNIILECDADACTETFKSVVRLQAHKINSHGMEPFKCQYCDKAFSLRRYLEKHEMWHGGSKEFKCDFGNCTKSFKTVELLKSHQKYHKLERIPCDTCGKAFLGKKILQQHIDSVHLGLKKYVCEVCGIHLATLYSLINHRLIHTGERPHKCPDPHCDKGFKQRAELVQHLERHHRGNHQATPKTRRGRHHNHGPVDPSRKTFICDTCGKGFVSVGNLRLHTRTLHADTPPTVVCETCGKLFRNEADLKVHVRIHSMERPYSCHICENNQPFRTVGALNAHLRRHRTKGEQFRPRGPMKTFKGRAC